MVAGLMPNWGDFQDLYKPFISNILQAPSGAAFNELREELGGSHASSGGFQPVSTDRRNEWSS
jgi:hypothetical protein